MCVASCPTQVLQPSFLEYGLLGIMQPRMDYISGYCNYECTICTEVCPSGAILNRESESKN
ncbi:MAG: 4Fe-4S dicluster domain-containing protein [Ignavibacteriales bacterium]|nr:4Fe-4S dicluster domain-containing protein [Ignavibacteriales bacterium]